MPSPKGLTGIWPLPTSPLHTSDPWGDGTLDEWAVVCGSSLPLYLHPEEASSWLLGTASLVPAWQSFHWKLPVRQFSAMPSPTGDRRETGCWECPAGERGCVELLCLGHSSAHGPEAEQVGRDRPRAPVSETVCRSQKRGMCWCQETWVL